MIVKLDVVVTVYVNNKKVMCIRLYLSDSFFYVNEIIYYFRAVFNSNLLMDFVDPITISFRLPTYLINISVPK